MSLMKPHGQRPAEGLFLGIEGGATRTVALLADEHGRLRQRLELGPANARLLTDAQLLRLFRAIRRATGRPHALGIGLAGARAETDHARIRLLAAQVWPGLPCLVSHDLDTALAAAEDEADATPQVLILSGTGSCCYGRTPNGRTAKVGGWGHILGDKGSGYEIGLRALQAVVQRYDLDGRWPALGWRILRALQLNEPNDLIDWAHHASKADIAALAIPVFEGWRQSDAMAADILAEAASRLAVDAAATARRLVKPGNRVQFVLAGSVLLKQPAFARLVRQGLRQAWPRCQVVALRRESAWGAVALARRGYNGATRSPVSANHVQHAPTAAPAAPRGAMPDPRSRPSSPTEARNPRSMRLDRLSVAAAIELMLSEDAKIPAAIRAQRQPIERAVRLIVRSLSAGGRLFYTGAGTSGRLGVLDASECPPTFCTPPELVQGIIAGGQTALWQSVEGAEDDGQAGAAALGFRGVRRGDVVVGIAASGRTPFVWGALAEAKRRRATTILLCFNPFVKIPRAQRPALVIAPNVGPEVLTGSTRLKAGTATKLILNMFTTLAMVRLGKVVSNLMVDLNPANNKLRDRATRIVQELTGVDYAVAWAALERSGWNVKAAWGELRKRWTAACDRSWAA